MSRHYISFMMICCLLLLPVTGCNDSTSSDHISNDVIVSGIIDGQEIIIIDVRTPKEYNSNHIPEAKNIPVDNLRDDIATLVTDEEKPIVVYCRSGNRSKKAAKILKDIGYKNVFDYGAIKNWPGDLVMEKAA